MTITFDADGTIIFDPATDNPERREGPRGGWS